ncbi:hypothetical protein NDU88_002994 [Pleurodeles waltl]|uniref:Uncharacterized protein n=1 Tax=Pleurodeles waltl TaxID=8319 RepID=A0AAV7UX77_PLEWA|nr:hypothetical protein NDU88_002994 [Pleurodeles waltl]
MEIHSESQELNMEKIIKAAREAAATYSKDWILKQIRGDRAGKLPVQEGHNGDRTNIPTRDEEEPQYEAKERQRNTSRGSKKGDKKEEGKLPEAVTTGPSKRAQANTGEQISAIVQECLKSMVPLLFAKPGGHTTQKGLGEQNPRGTQPAETLE